VAPVMRVLVYGNSGSGKTTMARALASSEGLTHLDLDAIAWASKAVRRSLPESVELLHAFVARTPSWVIEGCYGDLVEAALPSCTELRFLNPGADACVVNCKARPWEPSKYASAAEQDEVLAFLLKWVREYETRTDEYGLARHRAIFDSFAGPKREIRSSGEI
jgi:adenylate kinase family enzyme